MLEAYTDPNLQIANLRIFSKKSYVSSCIVYQTFLVELAGV